MLGATASAAVLRGVGRVLLRSPPTGRHGRLRSKTRSAGRGTKRVRAVGRPPAGCHPRLPNLDTLPTPPRRFGHSSFICHSHPQPHRRTLPPLISISAPLVNAEASLAK